MAVLGFSMLGCATDTAAGGGSEKAAPILSERDKADIECAKSIEAEALRFCGPKAVIAENHLSLAVEAWKNLAKQCLPGMYSGAAMRKFEKCVDRIEDIPGQLDEETIQRRIDSRSSAQTLTEKPEYRSLRREIHKLLREYGNVSWECKRAVEQNDAVGAAEKCAKWRQLEADYSRTRQAIEVMMVDYGMNPMDIRQLKLL